MPTTIRNNEERTQNSVSVRRATLAPSATLAKRQLVYTPQNPIETKNKGDNKVEEGKGRLPQEKRRRDTLIHSTSHLCHVGKVDNVQ